ncbi:MAG: winged helix DNA-binding domain-containing protein, partial [Propionibacteriaceae bacterium]|nr:winged helix DNA-binding domain-containing protein [Propionibacteriaceae bacterium]
DLADYFRLPKGVAEPAIADLEAAGALLPVAVQGWRKPAWRHRDAAAPRLIEARALLVPFDPLVFNRPRLEALFGFRFRLEYYLPKDKRLWGYYVMPFQLGDRLAARVDVKADRPAGRLLVHAAYLEPEAAPDAGPGAAVKEALAAELRCLADWLGLDEVVWDGRWTKPPKAA